MQNRIERSQNSWKGSKTLLVCYFHNSIIQLGLIMMIQYNTVFYRATNVEHRQPEQHLQNCCCPMGRLITWNYSCHTLNMICPSYIPNWKIRARTYLVIFLSPFGQLETENCVASIQILVAQGNWAYGDVTASIGQSMNSQKIRTPVLPLKADYGASIVSTVRRRVH